MAGAGRFGPSFLLNSIIIEVRAAPRNVQIQMVIGLGLALGLARFDVLRPAPDVQIQIAIGLGLALGLARFALVWLGLARCMKAFGHSGHLQLAWFGARFGHVGAVSDVSWCSNF